MKYLRTILPLSFAAAILAVNFVYVSPVSAKTKIIYRDRVVVERPVVVRPRFVSHTRYGYNPCIQYDDILDVWENNCD